MVPKQRKMQKLHISHAFRQGCKLPSCSSLRSKNLVARSNCKVPAIMGADLWSHRHKLTARDFYGRSMQVSSFCLSLLPGWEKILYSQDQTTSPWTFSRCTALLSLQYGKWDAVNYRATLSQKTGIYGRFLPWSCPGPNTVATAPVEKVLGGASLIFHF